MAKKISGMGQAQIENVNKHFDLDHETYQTRIKGNIRHIITAGRNTDVGKVMTTIEADQVGDVVMTEEISSDLIY